MKWNSIKSPKKSRERILEKKDGYGKKKLQIISSIKDICRFWDAFYY